MLPGPARVYDASGAVIAQNELARGHGGHADDWHHAARRDLGEGWHLQTWTAERRAAAPDAAERRGAVSGAVGNHSTIGNSSAANSSAANSSAAGATALSTLANSMAHSIRNPLSSIVTAAGLVQDDESVSEETAMLLEVIKKESRQLNRILTDFLNYVRPRPFQPARLDAAAAVRQTVAAMQRDGVLRADIQIADALPPELPAWADGEQLRQALWNIMLNAAEAMPQGGTVQLSGRTEDGAAILSLEDSGAGFSPEDLRRAFEPFYSNTPQGAGLGLAIACAAIERGGGRICLENRDDADGQTSDGARVCVELPLTEPPATP